MDEHATRELTDAAPGPAWMADALCRTEQVPTGVFFPRMSSASTARAKVNRYAEAAVARAVAVCARCPVSAECLAYAIDQAEPDGIWGGRTPNQRVFDLGQRRYRGAPRAGGAS